MSRLRVNDMRQISEPPAFLLVRESYRYEGAQVDTLDGFTLHLAPYPEQLRIRLSANEPMTLSRVRSGPLNLVTVDLDRQAFAREERLTRYDRRRRARLGGRRDACSVALVTRWRIDVFVEQGTDVATIERVANAHARITERAWRHGSAVDWARRALALRQRAERKRARVSK